jgi:hypothetical protein
MSYRFYDDYYYYNPAREKAIAKNESLVSLGERMKTSMCRIGQKKVKLFLNSLVKKGDAIAKMYRLILEAENHNINAKKYRNTISFSYKDEYYEKKREVIEELIKEILEYNKTSEEKIVFGTQKSDVSETSLIIYFELPDCEQISFHTDISRGLMSSVPKYKKSWDGKVNTTLPKIERAVNKRYSSELYAKYKKEIDAYEEAKRLEAERLARLRKEEEERLEQQRIKHEQKKQREREKAELLKSVIVDGIIWDDLKEYVKSKKDAIIAKECIQKLSAESQEKFKESYLKNIDISLPDVQENNLNDLNAAIKRFDELFIKVDGDILHLVEKNAVIDELTSAVVKFNSGVVGEDGTVKMFMSYDVRCRYILNGLYGKYTIFFDCENKPSELSEACYKTVTSEKAKKIGSPKMQVMGYLNKIEKDNK